MAIRTVATLFTSASIMVVVGWLTVVPVARAWSTVLWPMNSFRLLNQGYTISKRYHTFHLSLQSQLDNCYDYDQCQQQPMASERTKQFSHSPAPLMIEILKNRVVAPLVLSSLLCFLAPIDVLAFTNDNHNNDDHVGVVSIIPDTLVSYPSSSYQSSSTMDHASLLLAAVQQQQEISALDEVWNLVDKFYVNKASNTHWKDIRQAYEGRFDKAASVDEQMKIVAEMVSRLGDKYTRILTASQYADIQKFDLLGVGVTLMPNEGRIVVGAPPLPGSASDNAGLKVGDQVIKVNGVTTSGKTALDIIDQVSERPDATTLTMTILPKTHVGDESYAYDVTLDRTLISVQNPVRYKMDGDIGYIRVAEFNSLVLSKLEEALKAMPDAKGYVLDLRHNTGGAFQSAIEISSLFVSDKVAIYVVDNTEQRVPFRTTKSQSLAIDPDIPLVIWIDGRSASASEVLASALHDNCRAVLAGSNSFGKGLIQAVYGLRNGAGLVLTVARYMTPSGNDIQGLGIPPDIPGKVSPSIMGIPISSDTSSIDWADVRHRLAQCRVPNTE